MKTIERLCMAFFVVCASYIAYKSIAFLLASNGIDMPDRDEWPAWGQGIGSVGAILVAVYVSNLQLKNQRRRDKERELQEEQIMLRSIRDEVVVSRDIFLTGIGKDLNDACQGTAYSFPFKITDPAFPIFDAYRGSLGKITDQNIRRQIIITYAHANGLIESFRLNNSFIERVHATLDIAAQCHTPAYQLVVDRANSELQNYGDVLRDAQRETLKEAENLLALLNVAIKDK